MAAHRYDVSDEASLRKELASLREERRSLVEEYGDKGQRHPSARMIGGLNPAAQRLYFVRQRIAEIEGLFAKPKPVMESLYDRRSQPRYGLSHKISYRGIEAKAGTDNFGKWYVVADGDIVVQNERTPGAVSKAFAKWVDARLKEQP